MSCRLFADKTRGEELEGPGPSNNLFGTDSGCSRDAGGDIEDMVQNL